MNCRMAIMATVMLSVLSACEGANQLPSSVEVPERLRARVDRERSTPPVVERATYKGQPAFTTTATDRYDSGDEHSLFSADGTLICRFGGVAGEVTDGACDLDEIEYVSTLFDPG